MLSQPVKAFHQSLPVLSQLVKVFPQNSLVPLPKKESNKKHTLSSNKDIELKRVIPTPMILLTAMMNDHNAVNSINTDVLLIDLCSHIT